MLRDGGQAGGAGACREGAGELGSRLCRAQCGPTLRLGPWGASAELLSLSFSRDPWGDDAAPADLGHWPCTGSAGPQAGPRRASAGSRGPGH